MKINISCPKCGSNSYLVVEKSSNQTFEVKISKCTTDTGCNLDIYSRDTHETENQHYEDFEELDLHFKNRFNVLEELDCDCYD